MANTYLNRTSIGTPTNRKKFTGSAWVKRARASGTEAIIWTGSDSNNWTMFKFTNSNLLAQFRNSSSDVVFLQTNRVFRDTSSWYHIVCAVDTTQATASDRVKLYVNGVQETSFSTATYPSQNLDLDTTTEQKVGLQHTTQYFDGSMSHVHFTDGTAYDASAFGETDATTGEWVGKTSPSVTYGTNGFFILKDGNGITDQSGEGNDFTLGGGTLTDLKDNPDNVFCTANPLARYSGNLNYSNGNTTTTGSANDWTMGSSTMGASTGKWYYEYKLTTIGTGSGYFKMGFISDEAFSSTAGHIAQSALDGGYAFYCQNGNLEVRTNDAVISGYSTSDLGVSFSMGDIMCLAVDMDNKRAYFRKNDDAWIKSANPVTGTNGLDISADYTAGKTMIPAFAIYYPGVASLNFGNGYFGTTAVSSAGTNASDNGIFEYDVPTGYTALSTKGLNL